MLELEVKQLSFKAEHMSLGPLNSKITFPIVLLFGWSANKTITKHQAQCLTSLCCVQLVSRVMRPAEAAECVSGWIGQGANISASQASIELALCHQVVQQQTAPWLESCSCLALGNDGWWDRGGGEGGAVTYCRFRSYSCGGTVIISPLLLNSVILSYIRGARGQEILQFINRSTLCNRDYCMAYILTSLFGLKDFFSAVLPRLRLCSVVPYWVLSRGISYSRSSHTSCDLLCLCISMEKGR